MVKSLPQGTLYPKRRLILYYNPGTKIKEEFHEIINRL